MKSRISILLFSLVLFACTSNEVRIGVMADCQYCDCETRGSRHYRESPAKLKEAISFFNSSEYDFVVHLGDLIDRDFESYDVIQEELKALRHPFYPVLGNHEFAVEENEKDQVVEKLKMPAAWHSIVIKKWRCIVLDGNDVALYTAKDSAEYRTAKEMYDQLVAEDAPNAQDWNGGIGKEQLKWLEQELILATKHDENVLLFCHFPLFPIEAHTLWNAKEVYELLKQYPAVKGWFNGHNHAGSYAIQDDKHFVTFHGMVETGDTNSFASVTLLENQITIDGQGREPDRELLLK